MLFNMKYNWKNANGEVCHKSLQKVTSEKIRKFLRSTGMSVKDTKPPIKHAVAAFFHGRPNYAVNGVPYVTVSPSSLSKKQIENHKGMLAEKAKRKRESADLAEKFNKEPSSIRTVKK